ncbi:MAG: 2-oxo acid dehydrogenase subunit E2 [Nitrospiraceae bacterium]|nr:2-oxo acid dehydrogenase subunit E2 [Nitrospiraceae bacterium]
MADFLMPTLGADMTQGTLVAWKKRPGDHVTKGEIIAEVDTEKSAIEVESLHTGIVERLLVQPGDTVPVGTAMAVIREEGPSASVSSVPSSAVAPPAPAAPAVKAAAEADRLRISPAARKLAAERGIDPAGLHGTGPDSVITLEDVNHASAVTATASPEWVRATATERQARMRQTIAAAMTRSKREIPHYYLSTTFDMGPAVTWLKEANEKRPVTERLLYGVMLVKAVALALRKVPELNALWKGNDAEPQDRIHIGTAISLRQGGLVAPALHDADRQSLGDLMRSFQDLVMRARAGTLRSSEMSDPTITVTSLGEQGVETVFGVIYPPQVALVGFGKLVERPWVVGGRILPRPVITVSLSADHRVTDGHRGARFLAELETLLQQPESL